MNFCELNVVKQLQLQSVQDGIELQEIINKVSGDSKSPDTLATWLRALTSNNVDKQRSLSRTDLEDLFRDESGKIDFILYRKVVNRIREQAVMWIISKSVNTSIAGAMKRMKRFHSYNSQYSHINHLYEILDSIKTGKGDYKIANYLMINHLPELTKTVLSDVLEYDSDTMKYNIKSSQSIRKDWDSEKEGEQEPDTNSIIKLMLEVTPLLRKDLDFTEDYDSVKISSKHFNEAINNLISSMPLNAKKNFFNNPYFIIDYLKNKYVDKSRIQYANPADVIMYSFVYKWLYTENIDEDYTTTLGTSIIDIIVGAFEKYRSNTYVETNVDGTENIIETKLNTTSNIYGQLLDKVEMDRTNPTGFVRINDICLQDTDGQYTLDPNADLNKKRNVIKYYFGYNAFVTEHTVYQWNNALSIIVDYLNYNSKKSITFQNYLTENQLSEQMIIALNFANLYNPYVISGTKKSKAGKQLPVMGIKSVGNSVDEIIYKTEQKIKLVQQTYEDQNILGPKHVQSVTSLYTNTIDEELFSNDKMFLGTEYQASLFADENVKEPSDFSTPEAFKLAWKNWQDRKQNGYVRIQAITPSDKPKTPRFVFKYSALVNSNVYGDGTNIIPKKIIDEMCLIYKQQWLNSLIDISTVLDLDTSLIFNGNNALNYNCEKLIQIQNIVNNHLATIDKNTLHQRTHNFNKRYGTNKNIALNHDYEIKNNVLQVSNYHSNVALMWELGSKGEMSDALKNVIRRSFNNIKNLVPTLPVTIGTTKMTVSDLFDVDGNLTQKALKSDLYEYFLIKNILSENILVNTVGTPIAHNGRGNSWEEIDSKKHLTMVKRMVALTATMHACSRGSLSGLPDQINTITVSNPTLEMITYSGNSTDGQTGRDELKTSDGAMWCPSFVSILTKQSIADVKTKGIEQKLLLHSQDTEKASAYLLKMANCVIDNAYLRCFSDDRMSLVGARNPMDYIKMSLDGVSLKSSAFGENWIIDFNGNEIYAALRYHDGNDIILIDKIRYTEDGHIEVHKINTTNKSTFIDTINNDLFELFKAIGGQYTCDKDGVYNETSQEFIARLLINVGEKKSATIKSAYDVDQYLKKNIIHYFPSEEASKSLKTPTVDWNQAVNNRSARWTVKMDIDYFGVQLDPDHDADSGEIKEITQLMSFISKRMSTPELTSKIYNSLVELMDILLTKQMVDIEQLKDDEYKIAAKEKARQYFDQMMKRLFANPNTDVRGLANELMKNMKKIDTTLSAPFSDHQMFAKTHTSIGSMFRKYISRTWNGRADVLVPSYNQCMIYEDLHGRTFMANDTFDGNSIHNYLDIQQQSAEPIGMYEAKWGYNYYVVDLNGDTNIITIDSWDKFKQVPKNIVNGIQYIPAINLPRNLADTTIMLNVTIGDVTEKMNLYYLPVLRDLINNINRDENKKEYQNFLNALQAKDIERLQKFIPGVTDISWNIMPQETLTTNNYGSSFGISEMNHSKIQLQKETYFLRQLEEKFEQPMNVEDKAICTLYSADGTPTILMNSNYEPTTEYIPITPIVDDDNMILNQDKSLYKFITGARYYKSASLGHIIIVLPNVYDEVELSDFINSGNFIFYHNSKKISSDIFDKLKTNRIYKLPQTITEKQMVFGRIAKRQYESWLKSNIQISSRIPAQDLSFAAVCKTVGYLPYQTNIRMVPNSHVYIQGSDYDIDKVTNIMAAIDNNGLYKTTRYDIIFDNFDVNDLTEDELNVNQAIADIIKSDIAGYDVSDSTRLLFDQIKTFTEQSPLRISKDIIIGMALEISVDRGAISLLDGHILTIERKLDELISNIKQNLVQLTGLELARVNFADSTQNTILESIIDIYNDPRTWADQFTPTTMASVQQAAKLASMDSEGNSKPKDLRSHWDITTDVFVNQTTLVGKKDIGISAVAQKAFYALGYYYWMKKNRGKSVFNLRVVNIGQPFLSLGYAGTDIDTNSISILKQEIVNSWTQENIEGIDYYVKEIDGYNVYAQIFRPYTDDVHTQLKLGLEPDTNKLKLITPGPMVDFDITFLNSSIISSSTDNAKEMTMDVINATPEILPAYEFLLSLGIPVTESYKLLTKPIIKELIILSRGDLFEGLTGNRTSHLFNPENKRKIETKLGEKINDSEWKSLRDIFIGADELTVVGQALGINGGFKVDVGEPLLLELRLEKHYQDKMRNVDAGTIHRKSINLEKFLFDSEGIYQSEVIEDYEKYKSNYNLYDILTTVPHFNAMIKIPMLFKNKMQLISKDADNLYTIGKKLNWNYKVDANNLRMLLRAINDRKVRDFFYKHPFVYKAHTVYNINGLHVYEQDSKTKIVSTHTIEGLVSLKDTIEKNVIQTLLLNYPNNWFVNNLVPKTMFNTLLGKRISFYGPTIDFSDPQYQELTDVIVEDFLEISDEIINGHTVSDWMFVYNLLINKGSLGANSLSILFTNKVDLNDSDNIITQWVQFINQYDASLNTYSDSLSDWRDLPGLESKISYYDEFTDGEEFIKYSRTPDFNFWPFYIVPDKNGENVLIDDDRLRKLFKQLKLIIKNC